MSRLLDWRVTTPTVVVRETPALVFTVGRVLLGLPAPKSTMVIGLESVSSDRRRSSILRIQSRSSAVKSPWMVARNASANGRIRELFHTAPNRSWIPAVLRLTWIRKARRRFFASPQTATLRVKIRRCDFLAWCEHRGAGMGASAWASHGWATHTKAHPVQVALVVTQLPQPSVRSRVQRTTLCSTLAWLVARRRTEEVGEACRRTLDRSFAAS
jgi:hypothetical protein